MRFLANNNGKEHDERNKNKYSDEAAAGQGRNGRNAT
jgi:hypothetical protein